MHSKVLRDGWLALALGASACETTQPPASPASPAGSVPTLAVEVPQDAASSPAAAPSAAGAEVDAGQAAVRAWLALVDAEKYAESWRAAAQFFQSNVTEAAWSTSIAGARRPLGQELSRELKTVALKTSLPGAPDGKYVIVQFDSAFTNQAAAVETVTAMQESDGTWKVAGYFVR